MMPHNLLFKLELSNLIVETNFSEHRPQLRLPADSFQPSRSGRPERHPRQSRSRKSGQSTSHGLEFHHGCEHRPLGSPKKSLRPAQAYCHLEGKLLYLCDNVERVCACDAYIYVVMPLEAAQKFLYT